MVPTYLEHFCKANNGSLAAYEDHFNHAHLKAIEDRVQVYLTDKGLLDMPTKFGLEEFKKIREEVILEFTGTNKENFKLNEVVKLALSIKNVYELAVRVYEFNSETYYRNTMKPFDTAIRLQGLMPSFEIIEKDRFLNISKNKI